MKITAAQTLNVINAGNALVKTICSPLTYDEPWHKILKHLADPSSQRIKEDKNSNIDKNMVFNPRLGQWVKRPPKQFRYTKKTSVTLLPKDGIIHLFQSADSNYRASLALIFDVNYCDKKDEKYIFPKDANTHAKWWRKQKNVPLEKHQVQLGISWEELQILLTEQRKNGIIPEHNDLMVGLSTEAVMGILILENTLDNRLNAIAKKELIKNNLKSEVPIFIQDLKLGPQEYTLSQQLEDIRKADKSSPSSTTYQFVTQRISINYKDFLLNTVMGKNASDGAEILKALPVEVSVKILGKLQPSEIEHLDKCLEPEISSALYAFSVEFLVTGLQDLLSRLCKDFKRIDIPLAKMNMWEYQKLIKNNSSFMTSFIIENLKNNTNLHDANLLIDHLSNSEAIFLKNVLRNILENKTPANITTIDLLMKKCTNLRIFHEKKLVGYKFEPGWVYESRGSLNAQIVSHWSLLMEGMLNYDADKMASLIIKYFPKSVPEIMSGFRELKLKLNQLYKANDQKDYDIEEVKKCHLALLRQITAECNYTASAEEKWELRDYFCTQIRASKSEQELKSVKAAAENCYILNQRRHPLYDKVYNFFSQETKAVSTLKQTFEAVDQKAWDLKNYGPDFTR